MVEDIICARIKTADGKITTIPKSVIAWSGVPLYIAMQNGAAGSSSPDLLDVGCSSQEAAEFVVRYSEDARQMALLSKSPLLLMRVLELAFAIGSERLFFDGCLLLGDQLKWSTRSPLSAVLDGSRSSSELFQVFSDVVVSVRERFCLPRSSRNEDALLKAEIHAARAGLTLSTVGEACSADVQADVAQFEVNLKYIASFQPCIWQPNAECISCPDCGTALRTYFGLPKMGAISHCRACGKGKCTACVGFRVHKSLARVERPPNEPPDTTTFRKVCSGCFKRVSADMKYLFLSNAFMLSGLGILEISVLRFVCDDWRGAAELCLREYHNMLYTSRMRSEQSQALRKLVASSAVFYRGHPQAVIFLARSFDWGSFGEDRDQAVSVIEETIRGLLNPTHYVHQIPHLHIFCTRACPQMTPELCGYQLLEALRDAPPDDDILRFRQMAVELVLCGRSGDSFTYALIPLLADTFASGGAVSQEALDCLLEISSRSPSWGLAVFLEVRSRGSRESWVCGITQKILSRCGALSDCVRRTGDFLELLDGIDSSHGREGIALSFRKHAAQMNLTAGLANPCDASSSMLMLRPLVYPFDASVTIIGVDLRETSVKTLSNSKPAMFTLVADTGNRYQILHKRESVRKDAVVSSICSILQHVIVQNNLLWPTERNDEICLPNYGVIPISTETGLIEIVKGQTLQRIYDDGQLRRGRSFSQSVGFPSHSSSHLQQSVNALDRTVDVSRESSIEAPLLSTLKTLHQNEPGASPESRQRKVGRRFLASAKFFLVLNYILAIGDRHRDNVVLTPDGYILHIDFGYILGRVPPPEERLHVLVARSYVRFDGDFESCVRHYQRLLYQIDDRSELSDQDAIDGFLAQTADLFLALRPQTYAILILLQHLLNCGELVGNTSDSLAERLRNITMGGTAQSDAKKEFIRRIRESIGAESIRDWMYTKAKSIRAMLF